MQIALIEAGSPGFHVFKKFVLPRLGLPIMGAILRDLEHQVKIFCEDLSKIDWNYVRQSDLVGISTITCTAERAYEIAKKIKSDNPDMPVVIGGPHVTFLSDEPLDPKNGPVDIVVRKEGEQTIVEIVEWLENKRELADIQGISYKVAGKIINNPERALDAEVFDHIPFPALELIEGYERMRHIPMQATRGCHKKCTFCSVTPMFGNKLRCAHVDSVMAEIERLVKLLPGRKIFFYDDNFVGRPKWTKKLLRLMIERKLDVDWAAQVTVQPAKNPEMMDLLKRAGCKQVYIGLESINPKSLEAVEKKQTVEDITRAISVFHQYGITVHGMFVLGFDDDSLQTVRDTVRFAIKKKIDTVMFSILCPLPGSVIYTMLESKGRLLSKAWRYYDAHHVVFQPAKMTPLVLQKAVMLRAMPRFYSWGRVIKRALKAMISFIFVLSFKKQAFRNLLLTIYGHITVRRFRKQEGERAFFKELKKLPSKIRGEKAK